MGKGVGQVFLEGEGTRVALWFVGFRWRSTQPTGHYRPQHRPAPALSFPASRPSPLASSPPPHKPLDFQKTFT